MKITILYMTAVASMSVGVGSLVEGMWGLGVGSILFGIGTLAPVVAGGVGVESKSRK